MKKYLGNNCTVQMITYERSIKGLVQEKAALHDREVIYSVKFCLLFRSEAAFLESLNPCKIDKDFGWHLFVRVRDLME